MQQHRLILVPLAILLMVAVAGSTLGVFTARALTSKNFFEGFNLTGSGVQSGQVLSPVQWAGCVDNDDAFKSVYTFDNSTKAWKHYFNPDHPDHAGVPAYVNQIGGITEIRSTTALYVIVTEDMSANFPSTVTEANTCLGT